MVATFTITVSDALLAKLQELTARYNANNGTNLTVQDWLLLHLKELAIQETLSQRLNILRQQVEEEANQELERRLRQERDNLLGVL